MKTLEMFIVVDNNSVIWLLRAPWIALILLVGWKLIRSRNMPEEKIKTMLLWYKILPVWKFRSVLKNEKSRIRYLTGTDLPSQPGTWDEAN